MKYLLFVYSSLLFYYNLFIYDNISFIVKFFYKCNVINKLFACKLLIRY